MIPFLKAIARAYAERFGEGADPADFCFVFPNKRAGTFFLKYLREVSPRLAFAPKVTTISDIVGHLSGRVVNTRIDTLFLLHQCYCRIISPHLTDEGREEFLSFDSFRRWGETVLNDFNEVDIHLAPADLLFKNLFDFRSIASTFLTPEQRALMEEYFGYKVSKQYDDDKFWLEFGSRFGVFEKEDDDDSADGSAECGATGQHADYDTADGNDDSPRSRFIHLWKVLLPLYESLHSALAERGLTTAGGAYRLAVDTLESIAGDDAPTESLLPYKKMVMVGFNALSMSERRIFSLLQGFRSPLGDDEPFADFIWDSTGPVLADRRNSAGRFVAINSRDFPAPAWIAPYIKECSTDSLPVELRTVASPSKVMQVKIAADIIDRLKTDIGPVPFDEAKVAMVLPDESLLLPLLYSLPESVEDANLTMGYPLKLTAVTSFLQLLRRLQLMRRDSSSYDGYAFEEVRNLLGHPYAHSIIGTRRIRDFITRFEKCHISVVKVPDMKALGAKGESLLRPLSADASPADVIDYLDNALRLIEDTLGTPTAGAMLNGSVELANVRAWREALERLLDTIEEYGVRLSMPGTMAEAYRLLQGEIVAFEGEPLRGLQIMGMLETRALDFEHIVVVAANDRMIPRRSRRRSFLPNVLRHGYGLPPVNYAESLFAYYFFRLISRAKRATFIYDNRASGLTGGPSRYLLQLSHLYARGKVNHTEYKFRLKSRGAVSNSIRKDERVMRELSHFLSREPVDGRLRSLSASALKRYIKCPLQFYLQSVEHLRDDPAPIAAVDAITYGNIIHRALEQLLLPDPSTRGVWLDSPVEITSGFLNDVIARRDEIATLVRHMINRDHFHLDESHIDRQLDPATSIVADVAVRQIINVLRHDRALAPFRLYGCEVTGNLLYTLPDGQKVNMTYAIDRIDDAGCDDNPAALRIVDYKTGSSHIEAASMESVFNGSSLSDHYFQLQLYAEFLNLHRRAEGKPPFSIKPVIYPVSSIHLPLQRKGQKKRIVPNVAGNFIEWHDQPGASDAFMPRLDTMLTEIFDPDTDFCGAFDPDHCAYCAFKSICRN